ncbi:hypothetical protein J6590_048313, partial [Homalodisca vitripennis]
MDHRPIDPSKAIQHRNLNAAGRSASVNIGTFFAKTCSSSGPRVFSFTGHRQGLGWSTQSQDGC